jgi:transcriptional regulator with XRE-family HTH domain
VSGPTACAIGASPKKARLKTIRARLDITQQKAAAMLGISYPYLLSIETGQRKISRAVARKVAEIFGVSGIRDKNAEPLIRDPHTRQLVPFTKERHKEFTTAPPRFFIPDEYTTKRGGEIVTPTLTDYARCAHALLAAAQEQGGLRPAVSTFARWFASVIVNDAMYESLKRQFDKLFPRQRTRNDAFLALTVHWWKGVEHEIGRHEFRAQKRAARARQKKKRKD